MPHLPRPYINQECTADSRWNWASLRKIGAEVVRFRKCIDRARPGIEGANMPTAKETSEFTKEGQAREGLARGDGQSRGEAQARGDGQMRGEVQPRKVRFIVAPRTGPAFFGPSVPQTLYDSQQVQDALSRMTDVELVRRIKSARALPAGVQHPAESASQDLIVADTTLHRALYLQGTAPIGMVVERDSAIGHLSNPVSGFAVHSLGPPMICAAKVELKFHVQDTAGKAVSHALVWLGFDDGFEAENVTDVNGD